MRHWVYMMASDSGTLYIGSTSDLPKRVEQHRTGATPGFVTRYRVDKLVWFEEQPSAADMVRRERSLKGIKRCRKEALIRDSNPGWRDLSDEMPL